MSVYSEPIDTEVILERLLPYKDVLILACPYCASLSIAFFRDIPFYKFFLHPTCTFAGYSEAISIKKALEERGKRVKLFGLSVLGSPFCTPSPVKELSIRRLAQSRDAVVVLSCVGGLVGIKQALQGKNNCKVIHGMRTLGCGTFHLKWKFPFEILVDRKSARVSRFLPEGRNAS